MPKILFMTNSLYGGGAEKVLQTIISNLDYKKYDVTLYSMHRENIDYSLYRGKFSYKVIFDECQSSSEIINFICGFLLKIKGKIFERYSPKLFYAMYIRGKYDIEVAFIEGESTKIISGSNNLQSKKLAWVHVDLSGNPWTEFLYKSVEEERKRYLKFDKIICVSDSVRSTFINKYRLSGERIVTRYNPVDSNKILQRSQEKCNLLCKNRLRLISVGRLVSQKGFDRLLRVILRLRQVGFNFELIILGEGEDRKEYEKFIIQNDLANIIFLLGYQENPYKYMVNSDILVCSSRAEGFSTVILEAIILGIPVISTECAGVKESFGGYQCGMIVENTEDSIYQGLLEIFNNKECLEIFRKEAKKRSKEFVLQKSIKELEELFDA